MKALHLIDSATDIPALAFRLGEAVQDDRVAAAILAGAGFGRDQAAHDSYVVLIDLDGGVRAEIDPWAWPNGTMVAAHRWLLEHYDEVEHAGVVDAEPLRLAMVRAGAL